MKRLGIAMFGAMLLVLLLVAPAFAQGSVIEEPPEVGPEVIFPDVVARPPGGQAFTGIDVTVWMVLAAALLMLGVAFLVAASRRARTAGNQRPG